MHDIVARAGRNERSGFRAQVFQARCRNRSGDGQREASECLQQAALAARTWTIRARASWCGFFVRGCLVPGSAVFGLARAAAARPVGNIRVCRVAGTTAAASRRRFGLSNRGSVKRKKRRCASEQERRQAHRGDQFSPTHPHSEGTKNIPFHDQPHLLYVLPPHEQCELEVASLPPSQPPA
jgi:hypothetical protein